MEAVSGSDRDTIRELARRVADIAAEPVMSERRELWKRHNSLSPERAMVLLFPEGGWNEILPRDTVSCSTEKARRIEWQLRASIYHHEHFDDDTVIEKTWVVRKAVWNSGWGLDVKHHDATQERGAWGFDPVIKAACDLDKLKHPTVTHDEALTSDVLGKTEDLLGDILDVRLKGVDRISFHMMSHYSGLRGLTETMLDMYENPGMLHDAMAFLTEGNRKIVEQYVEMNLLDVNNDGTYHSSGGVGYTDELPADGFDPERVRPCDMWASAESQQLAQVSPEQHEEFALHYERQLLEPFGLNGYGCCEDLTKKLDDVKKIANIRRVSISPWADFKECARQIGGDYIFSWKPHPAHLVGEFDGEMVRGYIRDCLDATLAAGCPIEMILKDTHSCENHPERFDLWAKIAKEEALRAAGA